MDALDLAAKAAKMVVPSKDDENQYGWRWRVVIWDGILTIVMALFIAMALGAFSPAVSGYATKEDLAKKADKSDVDKLISAVTDLAAEQSQGIDDQIVRDINGSVGKYCVSKDGLRQVYLTELKVNLVRYQKRHNWQSYPQEVPPACG